MPTHRLSRRHVLGLAALGVLGACGSAIDAAPPRPVYPSRDLTGLATRTDLQDLVDQQAARGGGVLEIAAGQTFLAKNLVVPAGVDLDVKGVIVRSPDARGVLLTLRGDGHRVRGFPGGAIDGNRSAAGERSDVVRVSGAGCTLSGLAVQNSASNGIAAYGVSDVNIDGCRVVNSRDNGIIVGNSGADRAVITHNTVTGTDEQNGIFVTASSGSTATGGSVHDARIVGNEVGDVGDTGIESGIHTVNTLIRDNRVTAAKNPAILLRDCTGVTVENCTVTTTGQTQDAYAVVPQTQPETVPVASTFTGCVVVGNAGRAGFYLGSGGVTVAGARLQAAGGQDRRGFAFLTGAVSDVQILDPVIDSWSTACFLNYASDSVEMADVVVRAPNITGVDYVFAAPNARLTGGRLECGVVRGLGQGLFRGAGSTTLVGTVVVPPAAGSDLGGADTSLPESTG
jgi:parallel beta-helix repeat protein